MNSQEDTLNEALVNALLEDLSKNKNLWTVDIKRLWRSGLPDALSICAISENSNECRIGEGGREPVYVSSATLASMIRKAIAEQEASAIRNAKSRLIAKLRAQP